MGSVIQAYNPYLDNGRFTKDITTKTNSTQIETRQLKEKKDINDRSISGFNTETTITNEEREFFKKLFPESSELIEQHTLFTRNGKTQNVQVAKGILLDSRI